MDEFHPSYAAGVNSASAKVFPWKQNWSELNG